ncbi:MAG: TolC family protein [Oligoflexia bacterium]|nr:TolC family protein [Oligoflexia bacterium]
MRRLFALWIALVSSVLPSVWASAGSTIGPYNLDDCFSLALKRSDTLAIDVSQINQAEAQINEARANYFPTISGNGSFSMQQTPNTGLGQTIFPSNQSSAAITLKQNLFNGLKDLASIHSKKSQKVYYEAAHAQAVVQLFEDTAQAFYSVLAYRSDLKNYLAEIESDQRRRRELLDSRKFGRSRDADVVSVESSIANLEASASNVDGLLATYEETLAYLTGLPVDVELASALQKTPEAHDLSYWLDKIEERPDVKRAKSDIDVADGNLQATKAGYLPSLDFAANYYPYRPGIYQGIAWDTTLSLSIPLFSGGSTRAQVSEQSSVETAKEIAFHQTKEQASQSVRTVYRALAADTKQMEKLASASALAQKSYELRHKDNRLGIATNTDVLSALTSAQESKRSSDRQKFIVLSDYSKLLAESARLNIGK